MQNSENMYSLGIIWNVAQKYNTEIIESMKQNVAVIEIFQFDLGHSYKDFVYDIYSEEIQFKVDKKYDSMKSCEDRKVTIVIFKFDSNKMNYHPQKKKYVYTKLNDLKIHIRETYSKKIDNYVFDNIFHCTDDEREFYNDIEIISNYMNSFEEIKESDIKKYVKK